jgi:hypothetical protein
MQVFEGQEKNVARLVSEIKDEADLWGTLGAKHLALFVSSKATE